MSKNIAKLLLEDQKSRLSDPIESLREAIFHMDKSGFVKSNEEEAPSMEEFEPMFKLDKEEKESSHSPESDEDDLSSWCDSEDSKGDNEDDDNEGEKSSVAVEVGTPEVEVVSNEDDDIPVHDDHVNTTVTEAEAEFNSILNMLKGFRKSGATVKDLRAIKALKEAAMTIAKEHNITVPKKKAGKELKSDSKKPDFESKGSKPWED